MPLYVHCRCLVGSAGAHSDSLQLALTRLYCAAATNRAVQEVQERMDALQKELKQRSAHAEAARDQALAVLRKQTALREARCLHCP